MFGPKDQHTGGRWHEAEAGDVTIRFLVSGKGPPVVLLHGLSGSVRWWRRNIPALSREFRVFTIDIVHYKGDQYRSRFVLDETARRLAAWITALGLDRVSVIGHSMGGAIAAELASDFPDRVDRLVLANPAVLYPEDEPRISVPRFVRETPHFPLTLVPVLVADALRAGPLVLWNSARAVLSRDLREKLGTIRAPTLVVWGEHDGILSGAIARELCEHIPQCELLRLDDAGHIPMWEQPEKFNEAVQRFLSQPLP
jgi:pimeloyl-ACP methyl ester carboxylesterase